MAGSYAVEKQVNSVCTQLSFSKFNDQTIIFRYILHCFLTSSAQSWPCSINKAVVGPGWGWGGGRQISRNPKQRTSNRHLNRFSSLFFKADAQRAEDIKALNLTHLA